MPMPTKYKEEYCEQLIKFFERPLLQHIPVTTADGKTIIKTLPNTLPTVERFCFEIGIHRATYYEWIKIHPEFKDATERAEQLYSDFLKNVCLIKGLVNESIGKLLLMNTVKEFKDAKTDTIESTKARYS